MKAADVMIRDVITVSPDMPVMALARFLTERKISGAPVLEDGYLVGIVTEGDLVDRIKKVHLPTLITLLDAVIPIAGERQYENDLRKAAAVTVRDIMTTDVTVVEENTSIQEIATILAEQHISLLPVVHDNHLTGIIGKRDIIRGMLQEY
ncbi:MAG: CBS domain-containing protein [Magnetococcales bacterium]|nr:CBS domain-containing protein [Magnetococcales bacterium]MBF0149638.1 CBS domain-containing protein [Magnetococcales bacterium]MBF0172484.1 CBS domain-containing protein [Magnetococcales bacterium]MBF0347570.1 CBS domain-containing protein [Magnetococcales bacterium]MBF0632090.1 CBS domain-containing protein [Magnetococcales bacterium]